MFGLKRKVTKDTIIKDLQQFFIKEGMRFGEYETDKVRLWDILTALRGPDEHPLAIKMATTGVIRYELFGNHLSVLSGRDTQEFCNTRKIFTAAQAAAHAPNDHFVLHVQSAFKTLGLKWDAVNEQKAK